MGRTVWSHWDLWFCLVAASEFEGDLGLLADRIQETEIISDTWERKLAHIDDLRVRLAEAGLAAGDLAGPPPPPPVLREKASRRVLDQGLQRRHLTEPMRVRPVAQLRQRALRGLWGSFPEDPGPIAGRLKSTLEARIEKGWGGVRMARELRRRASVEVAKTASGPALLAFRRALVAVCLELFGAGLRDSSGEFGRYAGEEFTSYTALPWREAGIADEAHVTDLAELWTCDN